MRGSSGRRGVSTVVDVMLGLVLISAAVLTLVAFLEAGDDATRPELADRSAETATATTTAVEYSVEPVILAADDLEVDDYDDAALQRVAHGPLAGLLADAAVANVAVDGDPITHAGDDFERAVDGGFAGALETLHRNGRAFQVRAIWRPHGASTLRGEATAGRTPPPEADVSSATTRVPSHVPAARDAALEEATDGSETYDGVATVVATAVVKGSLPPVESQRRLESTGLERDLTVNRYVQFADAIEGADPDEGAFEAHLERETANATAANGYLVEHLGAQLATELSESYDSPVDAARATSTGEVLLVVRIWQP